MYRVAHKELDIFFYQMIEPEIPYKTVYDWNRE